MASRLGQDLHYKTHYNSDRSRLIASQSTKIKTSKLNLFLRPFYIYRKENKLLFATVDVQSSESKIIINPLHGNSIQQYQPVFHLGISIGNASSNPSLVARGCIS